MDTQQHYVKTAVRLPPDLHKAIHEARRTTERSFNAEILFRLRQTFAPQEARQ